MFTNVWIRDKVAFIRDPGPGTFFCDCPGQSGTVGTYALYTTGPSLYCTLCYWSLSILYTILLLPLYTVHYTTAPSLNYFFTFCNFSLLYCVFCSDEVKPYSDTCLFVALSVYVTSSSELEHAPMSQLHIHLFVVLILCYWSGWISDEECERVSSLDDPEWRSQLWALQNEDINLVLRGRWMRQHWKVLIYVRPVNSLCHCYYTDGWCEVVLLHRWMVWDGVTTQVDGVR